MDFSAVVGGIRRHWTGEVVRTAAAVNSQTRQINVIAELQDPYGKGADDGAPMAPGLFVNAKIEGKVIPDVLIAPRASLRGGDRIYIGNADQGTLSIKPVDLIYSDTDGAYVRSGIEEGQFAITSPIQAAFDGMSITVMERQPDGSIKTYEPKSESNGDTDVKETAMRLSDAEGAPE